MTRSRPHRGGRRLRDQALLPGRQILDNVWHYYFDGDNSVVETYVSYLRKKLERHGSPMIETFRLVGYSLRDPDPHPVTAAGRFGASRPHNHAGQDVGRLGAERRQRMTPAT